MRRTLRSKNADDRSVGGPDILSQFEIAIFALIGLHDMVGDPVGTHHLVDHFAGRRDEPRPGREAALRSDRPRHDITVPE